MSEPSRDTDGGATANSVWRSVEAAYVDAYSSLDIHGDMVTDTARMDAYARAIAALPLAGKTVLDVGTGTGVLAVLCVRAGAAHVYAVEASPRLAALAQLFVASNGAAARVTVLAARVEACVASLPSIDFIISEWMGYALLYESMWRSVLAARDALGGTAVMVPARAELAVAPFVDTSRAAAVDARVAQAVAPWVAAASASVTSGLSWEPLRAAAEDSVRAAATCELAVGTLSPEQVVGTPARLGAFALASVRAAELAVVQRAFCVTANMSDAVQGLALWFEVVLVEPTRDQTASRVVLGTGPDDPPTHWEQTLLYFAPLDVCMDDTLSGTLELISADDGWQRRNLAIRLELSLNGRLVRRGEYAVDAPAQ